MKKAFRIFISDPHAIFREGIKRVIQETPELAIAGDSDQIDDLADAVRRSHADLLLIYTIPFKSSIEIAGIILKEIPELKIVLLTSFWKHPDLLKVSDIGIVGIIHKAITEKELLIALEELKSGFSYYSQQLLPYLNKRNENETKHKRQKKEEWSEKELAILKYLCKGYNNLQISEELNLHCRSIEGYKSRMIEKAGVPNTVNLVLYALKNKLVNVSDF